MKQGGGVAGPIQSTNSTTACKITMQMRNKLPDMLGEFTTRNKNLSNTYIVIWDKHNLSRKERAFSGGKPHQRWNVREIFRWLFY